MVKRVRFLMNGLEAAGTVHVGGGRNQSAFLGSHLKDLHHERDVVVLLEPFADLLAEDGRSKGAEDSRRLILAFRICFMSARRGSQRIERFPSARGPHSMRPWNQPTTLPSAIAWAVRAHNAWES